MHNDGFRLTWRSLLFGVARSNEINGAQKESPGRGGQSGLKRAALKIYRVLRFRQVVERLAERRGGRRRPADQCVAHVRGRESGNGAVVAEERPAALPAAYRPSMGLSSPSSTWLLSSQTRLAQIVYTLGQYATAFQAKSFGSTP